MVVKTVETVDFGDPESGPRDDEGELDKPVEAADPDPDPEDSELVRMDEETRDDPVEETVPVVTCELSGEVVLLELVLLDVEPVPLDEDKVLVLELTPVLLTVLDVEIAVFGSKLELVLLEVLVFEAEVELEFV